MRGYSSVETRLGFVPFAMHIAADGKAKDTKMDHMLKYFRNVVANEAVLSQLFTVIVEEEFDSECIEADVEMSKATKTCNLPSVDAIIAFFRDHRLFTHAFSTGIVFWYWPWYKHVDDKQLAESGVHANMNFNGYTVQETYVSPHFESPKAEVLASGLISAAEFKAQVIEKGDEYIETGKCRRMKSMSDDMVDDVLHYGIKEGSRLSVFHIYSIILYKLNPSTSSTICFWLRYWQNFETPDHLRYDNFEAENSHLSKISKSPKITSNFPNIHV